MSEKQTTGPWNVASRAAMQQALDTLEKLSEQSDCDIDPFTFGCYGGNLAITALRTELAKPDVVSSAIACDRAYLNGLRAGFTFGHLGQVEDFRKSESAYSLSVRTYHQ